MEAPRYLNTTASARWPRANAIGARAHPLPGSRSSRRTTTSATAPGQKPEGMKPQSDNARGGRHDSKPPMRRPLGSMVEAAAVAFSGRKIDSMDSDWKFLVQKGFAVYLIVSREIGDLIECCWRLLPGRGAVGRNRGRVLQVGFITFPRFRAQHNERG
jgi:hypothetical protein